MNYKPRPYTGPGRRYHPLDIILVVMAVIVIAAILFGGCTVLFNII